MGDAFNCKIISFNFFSSSYCLFKFGELLKKQK